MDAVSMQQIAQQSISRSFGVFESPTIDSVKEKSISNYFAKQGKDVKRILLSFPSSKAEDNNQLFRNEFFASTWNMLMEEEEVAVMRLNTMNRLASIASENKKYLMLMRSRFMRSNIVGVDKNLDNDDESDEYDEYDEESSENDDYGSDGSYYYSSDSYEEYPQSAVLNESKGEKENGEGEKENEEGEYDDYEYDDYDEEEEEAFVEPNGTSAPIQTPNVNEVNKSEEYDDYYYYDDDDYDEDEEAFVEVNGVNGANRANGEEKEDYDYSSYEDEQDGPIEDGDDYYDSYSEEEEEWEEATAAATSQILRRK